MGLGWSKDERAGVSASDAEKNEFHKLLQECQGLTKDLVRDVVDLLRSIDLILPATQTLKDNLTRSVDKLDHSTTEEIFHLEKCQRAALQLYLATEGIQLCQKQGTMNTLDRLLQFIKKLVQIEVECKPGSFGEDLLEGYMKGAETAKTVEEIHPDVSETLKSDHKKKKKPDLIKDITHLEKANSELKQRVNRLEEKIASFYPEKKILNETIQKLESQLEFRFAEKKFKDLSNDLDNTCALEDQLEQLSSKLIEAEEGTAVLNEKIDLLNEENGRLTSQLISVDIDKAHMETEIKQLQEELNEMRDHIKTINVNLSKDELEKETIIFERDNKKGHNEELLSKLKNGIENLSQKLQSTNTRTTALNKECEHFKDENRILEKKWEKKLETELTQKSDDYKILTEQKDEKLNELFSMETELNETIKEREEENAKLNKTLQNANDNFGNVMRKLEREKEAMSIERDDEKRRNEELQTKFAEEIDNIRKELQDTETRTLALNKECERLKDEKRVLEKERDDEAQRNKQLETELTQKSDEHKISNDQKDERIKELTRRETNLNETIKEKEEENAKLNKTLQNANDNFGNVMRKSERDKDAMLIARDDEKRRNEELQTKFAEEIDNIRKELQDTETRKLYLNKECERLKDEKRLLEKERDDEAQRNKQLETELTQKSDDYKILTEQKDEKLNELFSMETELNETIKEREEENAKLNKTLQNANDNFGNVMRKLEREKEAMSIERDDEKRRNEELQTKFAEEIDNIRKELQDTETRTLALNKECERLKDEKRVLEKERDDEAQRNKQLETELTQKSDDYKILTEQKDEKLNELFSMETELNETIKEREEENAKLNKTLQNANDNFGNVMRKLEREKEAMSIERDDEKRRNEELQTKFAEEIDNIRKELQDTETRTLALNKECERLKDEKRVLEKERDDEAQRNKQLETDLTKRSDEHKILIEQKEEKINKLTRRETELDKDIKEREEENAKLNKTLQNANDNFVNVMRKSEKEKEAISIERDDEKRRKEELQTKFTEEIGSIRKELQDTETRKLALNKECERLKDDKRILEKEMDDEAQRNKQLETELTQKSEEHKISNDQKDEIIKELIGRETELNETIKEKEKENAKLNKTLQNEKDNFEKEKEMLVVERNAEQSKKEELKTRLANKIDNFKQQLQLKELKINDLTVVQSEMESKETECQNVLKEKEQKINELVDFNKALQKQQRKNKEDYENRKISLENENHRVQRQLDMLRSDLKAKSDSEKKLLEEARVLRVDLQEKKEHIEKINNEHENMKLRLTNEISAITEAQLKEKNTMEDRERTLERDLENVRSSNKTLNDQICKERNALKENENFITGLKKQMTHTEEEKTKLKTRLTKIAQDLENCTAENETMKNELEKIKSRKVIQIQMYSQSGVGLLSSVEDELKCVLKSTMDVEEGVDVDIINCAKASDIQPEIPLLILCIQASRLGTAVASTVQGLTLTPKMAVLIFHHKDVHALPNQASERVLTGQELRNLGGIFDLAFLSGKGIYTCEMNRSNFVSLINFIKREGKKRLREDL